MIGTQVQVATLLYQEAALLYFNSKVACTQQVTINLEILPRLQWDESNVSQLFCNLDKQCSDSTISDLW